VGLLSKLAGGKWSPAQAALELAGLAPGEKVLDVGCGTGTLALAVQEQVGPEGEVHGIDADPEMIAAARRKAGKAGVDLDFRVGLIEDIPFPDDQFDLVLSSLMIHHLPGDDLKLPGFAEIRRVLRPDGRLVVVDFEPPTGGLFKLLLSHILGHRMMENDVRELQPLVEQAGFTEVQVGRTSHRLLSFVRGTARKLQNERPESLSRMPTPDNGHTCSVVGPAILATWRGTWTITGRTPSTRPDTGHLHMGSLPP
jgi:demethylmenaquinone methyltransferase/2-methoxy-6-polyprenyl-1,4-benzoquinol methylase/phosphoethanolamine N-methyltransferase